MPKDRARAAFDAAKRLAAEGKYQKALEKHLWFHDHALEICESYYGVRLSFALANWVELARRYPPALVALRSIRDAKARRILTGEKERCLFHDVESINSYLHDLAATVGLFKKIEWTQPRFAASIYALAEESLVATGEYKLAMKHLDPAKRWRNAKRNYDFGIKLARSEKNRLGSRVAEASKRATEANFSQEVFRIVTVLAESGKRAAARKIQKKALAVLDNATIRNAIDE